MDRESIEFSIRVTQGLISILVVAVSALAWVLRKSVPSRAEHTTLDRRVTNVEATVGAVKQLAERFPSREEMADMRLQLERFNGNTRVLGAQLEGMREVQAQTRTLVGVMHETMLEKP